MEDLVGSIEVDLVVDSNLVDLLVGNNLADLLVVGIDVCYRQSLYYQIVGIVKVEDQMGIDIVDLN